MLSKGDIVLNTNRANPLDYPGRVIEVKDKITILWWNDHQHDYSLKEIEQYGYKIESSPQPTQLSLF